MAADDQRPHEAVLEWGASTHEGRVRPGNEDAYLAERAAFFVADGMGGHQAGEVASALAVSTLRERIGDGAVSVDVAVAAVVEANAAIFQGAHTNPDQRGMGTTLTGLVVLRTDTPSTQVAVLNVGDSRTYLFRSGRLRRVSVDHSYVQELVATGHITELEARSHPRRNIVTRALGIEPTVRVDSWVMSLARGDRYVICSDGLVDEVVDEQIADVLSLHASPQGAAEALVDLANSNGGRDNVTVVVVDALEGPEPPDDEEDLDLDLSWDAATDEEAGRSGDDDVAEFDDTDATAAVVEAGTTASPAVRRRRRMTPGMFLFLLALAAIATLTVTLLLVVDSGDDGPSPTTTSTSTMSTSTTSTSTTSTSTTAPDTGD